jgi:hypothetical protein
LVLAQIELMTVIDNFASERVAQKAGFELKSEIRDFFFATVPEQSFLVKRWTLSRATAWGTGGSEGFQLSFEGGGVGGPTCTI